VLKIISKDDFCVCLFGYSLFTLMVLCHESAVGLLGLFTIHKHKTDGSILIVSTVCSILAYCFVCLSVCRCTGCV